MGIEIKIKDQQSLYQLRHSMRPSYRFIAEQTGLGVSTISNLASNKSDGVSFHTLETLCRFFECGVADIIVLTSDNLKNS